MNAREIVENKLQQLAYYKTEREICEQRKGMEDVLHQLKTQLKEQLPEDMSEHPGDYRDSHHHTFALGVNTGNWQAREAIDKFFGGGE